MADSRKRKPRTGPARKPDPAQEKRTRNSKRTQPTVTRKRAKKPQESLETREPIHHEAAHTDDALPPHAGDFTAAPVTLESLAMSNAALEQRLEWLQTGLREIGALCLRLSGEQSLSMNPPAPVPTRRAETSPSAPADGTPALAADATISLKNFLSQVQDLTLAERLTVVTAAYEMLSQLFVHLPLKRAMHGTDPVQQLRLLRQRVEMQASGVHEAQSAREFHDEMIGIFHSLRDLHTNYILPSGYQGVTAFLPFLIEEYFESQPSQRKYVVTKVRPGFAHPTFKVGVTVTHWNGIPIDRAVELNAAREAGSNPDARHARGLEALTLRPMALTAPPDEAWVIIGYEAGGQPLEVRFEWTVMAPQPSADGSDMDAVGSESSGGVAMVMGVAAVTEAVRRSKKALFDPAAMRTEQAMAAAVARAGTGNRGATTAGERAAARDYGTLRPPQFPDLESATRGLAAAAAAVDQVAPRGEGADFQSLLPDHFAFRKVTTTHGELGYIRIFSFLARDANAFVAEFVRMAGLLPSAGLIIDVRGNGGGNIRAGEQLLQVLTSETIEPERFQFINTPATLKLCSTEPSLAVWRESIDLSVQIGESYSQGFPLTSSQAANSLGRRYQGPSVLVIDALCYSTTDIFSAGYQDHRIGPILGTSRRTGAGGANVWTYELFNQLPEFPSLPRGVSFRTAIRRSSRVRDQIGVPVEGLGVKADRLHFMTRNDVLGNNADLIAAAAALLFS
jgi:hypothetical protein